MMTTDQKKAVINWQKKLPRGTNFTLDTVLFYNQGVKLEHSGGEDGHYINVDEDGKTTLGTYEGAIQWITDAIFKPEVTLDLSVVDSTHVLHTLLGHTSNPIR